MVNRKLRFACVRISINVFLYKVHAHRHTFAWEEKYLYIIHFEKYVRDFE